MPHTLPIQGAVQSNKVYLPQEVLLVSTDLASRQMNAGDVVPESGGIRKVRWRRAGSGKSGGVRVIYFTRIAQEEIVLLTLYAKAKTDNITGAKLKEIRRALES